MINASIVILNYNSQNYLTDCLRSINHSNCQYSLEVIVADNHSTDNSFSQAQKVKNKFPTKFVDLKNNFGFAKGNNLALHHTNSKSKYIIFLNPDTTVEPDTFQKMITYFEENDQVSAATCKIILAATGQIQPECHRDFPTPLNAFLHFSGISSSPYFMGHLDYSKIQKINCCVGAFFMVRRSAGNTIGWWNEKYFFYGEDLDFCYQLRQHHFSLYYYPYTFITHFQGISSGITKTKSAASRATRIRAAQASTQAMRIFYQNNLINHYPKLLHPLINFGIKLLESYRVFKAKFL